MLCSHTAHKWATSDSAPRSEAEGLPEAAGCYVATLPTSGPLLIVLPDLKRRGSPRRQGSCSRVAHKWATSDSAPCFQAERLP